MRGGSELSGRGGVKNFWGIPKVSVVRRIPEGRQSSTWLVGYYAKKASRGGGKMHGGATMLWLKKLEKTGGYPRRRW